MFGFVSDALANTGQVVESTTGISLQVLITILVTVAIALLGWLITMIRDIQNEMKLKRNIADCDKINNDYKDKRSVSDCEKAQASCHNIFCNQICKAMDEVKANVKALDSKLDDAQSDLYEEIKKHSHAPDGRVIRG